MLGEAAVAMDMSNALLDEGVYIKGLWYPVVPQKYVGALEWVLN